jgi:hypothetical protein
MDRVVFDLMSVLHSAGKITYCRWQHQLRWLTAATIEMSVQAAMRFYHDLPKDLSMCDVCSSEEQVYRNTMLSPSSYHILRDADWKVHCDDPHWFRLSKRADAIRFNRPVRMRIEEYAHLPKLELGIIPAATWIPIACVAYQQLAVWAPELTADSVDQLFIPSERKLDFLQAEHLVTDNILVRFGCMGLLRFSDTQSEVWRLEKYKIP